MGAKREVTILLTTEEYEQLEREANQLAASVPDLFRHYVLKKPLPHAMLTKIYWTLCQINEKMQVFTDQVMQQQKTETPIVIDLEELTKALDQIKAFQRYIVGTQISETMNESDGQANEWLDWEEA